MDQVHKLNNLAAPKKEDTHKTWLLKIAKMLHMEQQGTLTAYPKEYPITVQPVSTMPLLFNGQPPPTSDKSEIALKATATWVFSNGPFIRVLSTKKRTR